MSRSWKSPANNSSPGFVYFNTSNSFNSPNNSHNTLDTPEFLSFGDSSPGSSPHGNQFSPSSYSSPRNHYGGKSPRQRGGRYQHYSPIKQTGGKYWRRNTGLAGSAERNINTNSQHDFVDNQHYQNRQNKTSRQRHSFSRNIPNQSFNTSAFYDRTCLKDPWAELEQKLAEDRKKEEENLVKFESSQSTSQCMDVKTEEASSVEGGSEDSEEVEESFS